MGTSISIGIQLTSPSDGKPVIPGSTVSGTVYLSCGRKTSATALQLAVVGREVTTIKYEKNESQEEGGFKTVKYSEREQHRFFLLRWDLAKFTGDEKGKKDSAKDESVEEKGKKESAKGESVDSKCADSKGAAKPKKGQKKQRTASASVDSKGFIKPVEPGLDEGQYEFPFEFQLPEANLPSTFRQECGKFDMGKGNCMLQYFIEARFGTPDSTPDSSSFQAEAVAALPFTVVAAAPSIKNIEPLFVDETQNITFCCCLSKGTMDLKVALNKDAAKTGDPLEVLYEATNASTVNVNAIDVELRETIKWKAGEKEGIGEKKRDVTLFKTSTESMPAQKLNEGQKTIPLEDDPVTMVVPKTFRSDYRGSFITCRHSLHVTLQTGFGVTNPTVEFPICVYDQHVESTLHGVDGSDEAKKTTSYGKMEEEEEEEGEDATALPLTASVLPSDWEPKIWGKGYVLEKAAVIESKYPPNFYRDAE